MASLKEKAKTSVRAKTTTVLAAAAAGILLLFATGATAGGTDKKKKPKCDPSPFVVEVAAIKLAIVEAVAAGMRENATVAAHAAESLYIVDPSNDAPLSWPPQEGASEGQRCVWSIILAQVDIYLNENGIPPWPACPAGSEIQDGQCLPVGGIDLDPWLNPSKWPQSGTFIQVEKGDTFLGSSSPTPNRRSIVYSTLLSTAHQAAIDDGASAEAATEFAQGIANDPSARVEYLTLIYCSPWNDALYGTFGYDPALIGDFDSPVGRAIRLLPYHFDNYKRIIHGQSPRRNIHKGSAPGDKSGTRISSAGKSLELLWLPELNPEFLLADGTITTQGMTWEDGSSRIMPPPIVEVLGVEDVPPGMWGCLGEQSEYS